MSSEEENRTSVRCCVAGGGPAGMMLAFLLARAGIEVTILEKHRDFLRDFRGDTIHPSTLELMYELGLIDEFLLLPHQEIRELSAQVGDDSVILADLTHLPTKCKFLAFMPQWDFLNFLAEHGKRYPTFKLRMETEVKELIFQNGAVGGVRVNSPTGPAEIMADLVVGADGRHSIVRTQAQLQIQQLGAPMDVLWFRLARNKTDPGQVLGRFASGKIMVMLNRDDYWQCGFVIAKGSFESLKARGLPSFHNDILSIAPFLKERVGDLKDWNNISLLTVAVDRLLKWHRRGLLCIGDAAHAMSPVGGVGINLAIQDAVATANILYRSLSKGIPSEKELRKVQRRRLFPTRVTQRIQVFIQNRVIVKTLGSRRAISVPFFLKLLRYFPILRRIPARVIGVGVRAEHIHTPDFASKVC